MIYFKKKHTIYRDNNLNNNNNYIKPMKKGFFGFYFCESGFIDFVQYKALIFFHKTTFKKYV